MARSEKMCGPKDSAEKAFGIFAAAPSPSLCVRKTHIVSDKVTANYSCFITWCGGPVGTGEQKAYRGADPARVANRTFGGFELPPGVGSNPTRTD